MKIIINLNDILVEANDEIDLVPYFVKLKLSELGCPVIIDPTNIADPDIDTHTGSIEYTINVDTMIMEIIYHD